jgi:hypothetical protein
MTKSKTMWFATILAVLGMLQTNLPLVQEFMDPETYGYLTIVVAMIVAGLRVVTNKPLKDK